MVSLIITFLTVFAAVSVPVSILWESRYGFGKKARLFHGICAALGIVMSFAVYFLFKWKVGSAAGDVRGWAEDFFFEYFNPAFISVVVLSAILGLAAAIDHPMRRIRKGVAALLPIAVILTTVFVAFLSENGQFAVDFYIRALAPGLGLIAHISLLPERKKQPKRR